MSLCAVLLWVLCLCTMPSSGLALGSVETSISKDHSAANPGVARRAPVTAMDIAPDGKTLIAAGQFGVEAYPLDPKAILGQSCASTEQTSRFSQLPAAALTIKVDMANVHAVAFSPDGQRLAVGGGAPSDGGSLAVLAWPSQELLYQVQPHADLIYDIAWSADGQQLATVSYDREVKIVAAADGAVERTLSGHSRPVLAVEWFADTSTVVTAGVDRSLRVWNAESGALVRSSENHTQTINALSKRPQTDAPRPMVLSAGADKTVRFWQPTIGRLVRFARVEAAPLAAAWSSNGKWALAACEDGSLHAINPDTAESVLLAQVANVRLECLAVVPNAANESGGDLLFVGDAEGRIWFGELAPPENVQD